MGGTHDMKVLRMLTAREVRRIAKEVLGCAREPSATSVTNWTREGLPCERVPLYGRRVTLRFPEEAVRPWLERRYATRSRGLQDVAEVGSVWVYRIAPALTLPVVVDGCQGSRDSTGVVWVRPVDPFPEDGLRPRFPVARSMLVPLP